MFFIYLSKVDESKGCPWSGMFNEIVAEGSGKCRTLTVKNEIDTIHHEINFQGKKELFSCGHAKKMIY